LDEPNVLYHNKIMKNIAQIETAINETLIKPDKPIIIFRHIRICPQPYSNYNGKPD